ncbi:hypothetical protein ACMA1I_08325 [Pontibacter sp. 13R65]|uniref:hypothetical protein n=1 Tax=Pontibacter sp. 13R65 TaxID=3127458 RepID=UPI00301E0ACB
MYIQADGRRISSDDAKEEQEIKLDKETLASLQSYFEGTDAIAQTSPDYTCLKSMVKAKTTTLERMLQPGQSTDNDSQG